MYHVYILRGAGGRHYIGQTNDLPLRLAQHRSGHTYTTRRLGGDLALVASRRYATRAEAIVVERKLKAWGRPELAIQFLQRES